MSLADGFVLHPIDSYSFVSTESAVRRHSVSAQEHLRNVEIWHKNNASSTYNRADAVILVHDHKHPCVLLIKSDTFEL